MMRRGEFPVAGELAHYRFHRGTQSEKQSCSYGPAMVGYYSPPCEPQILSRKTPAAKGE
jgi:hypothetical protein